jgi:hypothetical protein
MTDVVWIMRERGIPIGKLRLPTDEKWEDELDVTVAWRSQRGGKDGNALISCVT